MSVYSELITSSSGNCYPKLMAIHPKGIEHPTLVVLFTDISEGTVVYTTDNDRWTLGENKQDWDDRRFVDYYGDVLLKGSGLRSPKE